MYEFYIISPPLPLCIPPRPIAYFPNFVKLFFLIVKAFPPNTKTLQSQEKLLKLFKLYKVILFFCAVKKNLTNFLKCVSWLMQSWHFVKFIKFSYMLASCGYLFAAIWMAGKIQHTIRLFNVWLSTVYCKNARRRCRRCKQI